MSNDQEYKKKLIALLSPYTTQNKLEKMDQLIHQRTRYVVPVLEDIFQSLNANAVVRTAECFGIQDVHMIEVRNQYAANVGIAKGAADWTELYRYTSTGQCYDYLRSQGYVIVATSPHRQGTKKNYELHQLPVNQKIALIFGTEETGLSDYALQHADAFVSIPMYGFTESFNISVSAALCLYDVTTRMRAAGVAWQMSEDELIDVRLAWLRRTVRASAELERRFKE